MLESILSENEITNIFLMQLKIFENIVVYCNRNRRILSCCTYISYAALALEISQEALEDSYKQIHMENWIPRLDTYLGILPVAKRLQRPHSQVNN